MSIAVPERNDPYPSPVPGPYTLFFFGPFAVLNPVWFLMMLISSWGIPEPIKDGLALVIMACWWWYSAGVMVRGILKPRQC